MRRKYPLLLILRAYDQDFCIDNLSKESCHPVLLSILVVLFSEFSETIRNTIEKMTKEMENLQRRMASLENRRQPEVSSS